MKKFTKNSVFGMVTSVIVLLSLVLTTTVCFAWSHPDTNGVFNVTLYSDQKKTYSGAKPDAFIYFEGKNNDSSRSSKKIYFRAEYSDYLQEDWYTDVQYLVEIGNTLARQSSNTRTSSTWWRLTLDNYGIGNGGTGYGWMW